MVGLIDRLKELQKITESCDDNSCGNCENFVLCDKYGNDVLAATYKEAVDVIEALQGELQSVKIEANNYRKALEAFDGVKK